MFEKETCGFDFNQHRQLTQAAILNKESGPRGGNVRLHKWKREGESHGDSIARAGLRQ